MKIVEAWKTVYNADGDSIYLTEEEAYSNSEYSWVQDGYALLDEHDKIVQFFEDYFDAERHMSKIVGGVAIGQDYIAIYDQGEEIAYWTEEEWLNEPKLAINLANAIRLYYTHGPAHIRKLLGKEIL